MALALEIYFTFLQLVLIALCVFALKKVHKQTLYSYKTISFVGGIIFLSVCFLDHFLTLLTWPADIPFEFYHFANYLITSFTAFANVNTLLVLPFLCIFLIISNIVLLKKEGKSLANLLGVLLCSVLLIGASGAFFSYDVLDHFMDVHSYAGYCFSLWIEGLFAVLVSYFEAMFYATVFISVKAGRHKPKLNKDYIIILGCRMRDDGKPAGLLRARINRALEFAKLQKKETKKNLIFVPSGGQGADEPLAEAASMQNYLLEKRVPKTQIVIEDKSKTTQENFKFSKSLVKTTDNVTFATSSYHVFRAGVIATTAGFKNIEGIGSKSPWYYHSSALIREFIANINSEKRFHLRNIIVIITSLSTLIAIGYFTNIL